MQGALDIADVLGLVRFEPKEGLAFPHVLQIVVDSPEELLKPAPVAISPIFSAIPALLTNLPNGKLFRSSVSARRQARVRLVTDHVRTSCVGARLFRCRARRARQFATTLPLVDRVQAVRDLRLTMPATVLYQRRELTSVVG